MNTRRRKTKTFLIGEILLKKGGAPISPRDLTTLKLELLSGTVTYNDNLLEPVNISAVVRITGIDNNSEDISLQNFTGLFRSNISKAVIFGIYPPEQGRIYLEIPDESRFLVTEKQIRHERIAETRTVEAVTKGIDQLLVHVLLEIYIPYSEEELLEIEYNKLLYGTGASGAIKMAIGKVRPPLIRSIRKLVK